MGFKGFTFILFFLCGSALGLRLTPANQVKLPSDVPAFIVTHASSFWDRNAWIKPELDRRVAEAKKYGLPIVYLMHVIDSTYYLNDMSPSYAVYSQLGEFHFLLRNNHVISSGGFFEQCHKNTCVESVRQASKLPGGLIISNLADGSYSYPRYAKGTVAQGIEGMNDSDKLNAILESLPDVRDPEVWVDGKLLRRRGSGRNYRYPETTSNVLTSDYATQHPEFWTGANARTKILNFFSSCTKDRDLRTLRDKGVECDAVSTRPSVYPESVDFDTFVALVVDEWNRNLWGCGSKPLSAKWLSDFLSSKADTIQVWVDRAKAKGIELNFTQNFKNQPLCKLSHWGMILNPHSLESLEEIARADARLNPAVKKIQWTLVPQAYASPSSGDTQHLIVGMDGRYSIPSQLTQSFVLEVKAPTADRRSQLE